MEPLGQVTDPQDSASIVQLKAQRRHRPHELLFSMNANPPSSFSRAFVRRRFTGIRALLALSLLPFALATLTEAQPLQDALFTVGTSAKDGSNDDWAYLLFQLTSDGNDLLTRRLAIYEKPGGINTPGFFEHSGNVALQYDPIVIAGLLARAAAIGQAPGDLNSAIDELFGDLVPSPDLSVEEKLSAVIMGSIGDPRQFGNLMLLARMHPGVSLCLGLAHAQRIGPGVSTFEIREIGPFGQEIGVVGRVEVDAASPVVLPAPGAPVAVPDTSPKGHLNARLRWASPDPLRRLALLQYGFNVYRVDRTLTESLGWDETPPDPGMLADLALTEETIQRVNRSPVLPSVFYDAVSVLDLEADPNTAFVADDNGLSEPGAVRFEDGDRFYYFVTARDILGRDGFVSPGTMVMMSDRVPPHSPRRPEVHNEVAFVDGEETHHLKVTWRQTPFTPDEPISGYYVYRWANPGDVQKYAINPLVNQISNFIPHVPGEERLSFIDNGLDAPTVPEDYDKTFWYTVRAVKPTALGGNLSANSAPAFGVLRNRFAPEAPVGRITIHCCLPNVMPDRIETVPDREANDPLRVYVDLVAIRETHTVTWAEFALHDPENRENSVGRFNYLFNRDQVGTRLDLGRRLLAESGEALRVFSRVGDSGGNVSAWVELTSSAPPPTTGSVRRYIFRGVEDCSEVRLVEGSDCDGHSPGGLPVPGSPVIPEDGQNPSNPIVIAFDLTDRAEEYRVYRRVDNSNLTLWRQGLADEAEATEIVLEDAALPPNAGEVSYFGQLLDDNGNASELKLLGTYVAIKQPAPDPMLSQPEVDGSDGDPRMKIRWFCPPHGVERFEIMLGVMPGSPPHSISPELSSNVAALNEMINLGVDAGGGNGGNVVKVGVYRTPALEGGFGFGPDYEISVPVLKGTVYHVQIRAVAKSGGPSSYSNSYSFVWPTDAIDEATGPMVPWPARTPPAVGDAAHAGIKPIRVEIPEFNGLGVVIGEVPADAIRQGEWVGDLLGADADLRDYLFDVDDANDTLLPLVLYRYQVPSTAYPQPSGDLIQVSPMMIDIVTVSTETQTVIRDPFVKLLSMGTGTPQPWPIVLLDTQPAVRTASYAYVIVRFRADGEIASVHPVPPINVE